MDIYEIRERIRGEIFSYQTLTDALKNYSYPRDKITGLLKRGFIIRVKKGLYVFGERFRRHPYAKELLANLIFGPSYISLDYALAYHGLIPERVEALTSVTVSRSRRFRTPVGLFIYRRIPPRAYQTGMMRVETNDGQAFLMASPEKALADKIVSVRGIRVSSVKEMGRFLEENLRIDAGLLASLSYGKTDEFARGYRSLKLRYLSDLIRRTRKSAPETRHE